MKHGFIKTSSATLETGVADCTENRKRIFALIKEMEAEGSKIMVFPELSLTGYTCSDLFLQGAMIGSALDNLLILADETADVDALIAIGLPFEYEGKLYNCAALLNRGNLLGLVTKTNIPNYSEYYEVRHFAAGPEVPVLADVKGRKVWMGRNILFSCPKMCGLKVGAEICEDLWVPAPPSISHVLAGANVILNLSAGDEFTGKAQYRRDLVAGQSARLVCGYIYAASGDGESTTDMVFSGHNMIAENGSMLAESERFINETVYGDIDIKRINSERRRMSTFPASCSEGYVTVPFDLDIEETRLTRTFPKKPFVPSDEEKRNERCDEILQIQAMGLKKRVSHTHAKSMVIGLSGGLDSTLALLVCARACDLLGADRKMIVAVTMPCFGTTDRTYNNACALAEHIGAQLKEVNIKAAVSGHFKDIGHDPSVRDVTYENCQARERTQVLMDISNQTGGFVIGTGDLSELALGWATYNADHMSMYGVNASIPKTLVRYLVAYYADTCGDEKLAAVLRDILDTPVSPELLPPEDGKIAQKTEDIVGPYELHDFFLYYMLRALYEPDKIYRIALKTFAGEYDSAVILKWLKNFYRRFFSQQFKRSCLPDGPKVGTVAVSPRGDLRMPSDASAKVWLDMLEGMQKL